MPNDAFALIQNMAQRLGRQPTLVELLSYAGADPAGQQVGPPVEVPPSQRPPEHGDGYLTAHLQSEEMIRGNPELLKVRDQMVRMLLFGLDGQNQLSQGGLRLGGGYLQPPSFTPPGPIVRRGIGGGGYATGSGPASPA
jgi:hypothetical protein